MELSVKKQNFKIGVAVSGGIDSMCLLYCYRKMKQDLVVINVEHGIRGETSLRDTDFVRNYCVLGNIPFLTFSVNVPESLLDGESVETCARRLRYEIFDKLISDGTVQKIALAHHADDNAETVLMRIFRGTGIHGLVGITDRDNYLRPFVKYSRKDIESFAAEYAVPYVLDETNLSSDYTRNYIRNSIIPLIKIKYPAFLTAVARLSENASEIDEYLLSQALPVEATEDGYCVKGFFSAPIVIQKYTVMQIIHKFGFMQDFETRHVGSVIALAKKSNNTTIDLPFNLCATKYDEVLYIERKTSFTFEEQPYDERAALTFAGKTYRFLPSEKLIPGVSFDPDKIPEGAVIRLRKDGDKFKRVNGKTKLLSDFLNEKKLTNMQKNKLLVLAKGSKILAILGLETSDYIKITEQTNRIVIITKE